MTAAEIRAELAAGIYHEPMELFRAMIRKALQDALRDVRLERAEPDKPQLTVVK